MNDLKALTLAECEQHFTEKQSLAWLSDQLEKLSDSTTFFIAFGMAPRKVGKAPLDLSVALMQQLTHVNPDASHVSWSMDELARLTLLLHLPQAGRKEAIKKLLVTSDIREQILLYKSIQYLPNAQDFEMEVIDGIRTNMIDVFDAIALHNSFPVSHFQQAAWNQMVLKAIFMERPIYQISGLDERCNSELARIAIDFAHERQAAGRKVTPELWRLVAPFVDQDSLKDLINVARSEDGLEQEAGIRALDESDYEGAKQWLLENEIQQETRPWNVIGEATFNSK